MNVVKQCGGVIRRNQTTIPGWDGKTCQETENLSENSRQTLNMASSTAGADDMVGVVLKVLRVTRKGNNFIHAHNQACRYPKRMYGEKQDSSLSPLFSKGSPYIRYPEHTSLIFRKAFSKTSILVLWLTRSITIFAVVFA